MKKTIYTILILIIPFITNAADYEVGQVWKYKTRFLEGKSTLTILKIEKYHNLGDVIHIRVDNIQMVNKIKGNEINEIPHLPFKKSAIDNSVTELVTKVSELPDFKEGYEYWRKAYNEGQAGAFDLSVKDALRAMLGAEWVEKE